MNPLEATNLHECAARLRDIANDLELHDGHRLIDCQTLAEELSIPINRMERLIDEYLHMAKKTGEGR